LQTIFEICANTKKVFGQDRPDFSIFLPTRHALGRLGISLPARQRPAGLCRFSQGPPGLGPARTRPSGRPDRPDPVHTARFTTAHTRLGPARPSGPERSFLLQGGSPSACSQPPAERPRKPSLHEPPRAKPALTSINQAMLHDARPTASSPRTHPFTRTDPACQLAHRRTHTRSGCAHSLVSNSHRLVKTIIGLERPPCARCDILEDPQVPGAHAGGDLALDLLLKGLICEMISNGAANARKKNDHRFIIFISYLSLFTWY
jgi:hypothetical protein